MGAECACVCVSPCNHKRKHSEVGQQGTHAAPAMSSVHVSVPLCLYTSGTAGERVALGPTSHHHYSDCEGCDGEVLPWLQSQMKQSLRFVTSTTHSMNEVCACVRGVCDKQSTIHTLIDVCRMSVCVVLISVTSTRVIIIVILFVVIIVIILLFLLIIRGRWQVARSWSVS